MDITSMALVATGVLLYGVLAVLGVFVLAFASFAGLTGAVDALLGAFAPRRQATT